MRVFARVPGIARNEIAVAGPAPECRYEGEQLLSLIFIVWLSSDLKSVPVDVMPDEAAHPAPGTALTVEVLQR